MKIKNLKLKNNTLINPILIIFFAVTLRLLPHPANFAPIGAMALFGGAYLDKKYALIVPLVAMLISDLFLGFHATVLYVYSSFLLIGLIGLWLRNHKNIKHVIGASLLSSTLFFLITNFGVWMQGAYARDITGLIQSYVMGLPFFRNSLIGDLFYVGLFFGAFELSLKLLKRPAPLKA
jgi:hypothetical protein